MGTMALDLWFAGFTVLMAALPFFAHLAANYGFPGLRAPLKRQKAVVCGMVAGLLPAAALCVVWRYGLTGDATFRPTEIVYLLAVYCAAAYVYGHFFNMSETARRIRLLVGWRAGAAEKEVSGPGGYDPQAMLRTRLDRLIALGEIVCRQQKYSLDKGWLVGPARLMAFGRRILFPDASVEQPPTWGRVLLFVVAALALAVAEALLPGLPPPYDGILFAVAGGGVITVAFMLLAPQSCLHNYLLAAIPYLFVTVNFILSPYLPAWDTLVNHFPFFRFIAEALATDLRPPSWLPVTGGVDVGLYHINYFPFMPNRLAGYFLQALTPISFVTAFKVQLVLGALLTGFGWYAVLALLTQSQPAAFLGTLCLLMGGTGISFHQEQVFATCHLLPWFTLCLLKMREQPAFILPATALFGLGLSTHYPQIQIIALGLVAIAVLLWRRPGLAATIATSKRFLPWMILLLALGSLPSLYVWAHSDELAGRKMEKLQPSSYDEYVAINSAQVSSAPMLYFQQYVDPILEKENPLYNSIMDVYGMFVGRIALLAGLAALVFRPALSMSVAVLFLLFSELTLGMNSHLAIPRLFYEAGIPFMNVFRQWYHFFPFVNFCLSLLAALGFAAVLGSARTNTRLVRTICLAVVFLQGVDLSWYDRIYVQNWCMETPPGNPANPLTAKNDPLETFQYKDRFKLTRDCSYAIPNSALLTRSIATTDLGVDEERRLACKSVYNGIVTTNIPNSLLPPQSLASDNSGEVEEEVRSWGVRYRIANPDQTLLVSSMNYSLKPTATVDGQPATIWRVNGALAGLLLEPGSHEVVLRRQEGIYPYLLWLHIIMYLAVGVSMAGLLLGGPGRESGVPSPAPIS